MTEIQELLKNLLDTIDVLEKENTTLKHQLLNVISYRNENGDVVTKHGKMTMIERSLSEKERKMLTTKIERIP